MIFAEIDYEKKYPEMHDELVDFFKTGFPAIQHEHQGDSWIWIFENEEKVTIDTFSSMKHQIKASSAEYSLINKIIEYVRTKYAVVIYTTPELEAHE